MDQQGQDSDVKSRERLESHPDIKSREDQAEK